MKAWFMYDNHTFARIELSLDEDKLIDRVRELFEEDGCGSIFVRDAFDATLNSLSLHGRRLENGRYGLLVAEIKDWVAKVREEYNFARVMMG